MVIFYTLASLFIQALLYYGANTLSCKLGLTSGTELFTMCWVVAAGRYLHTLNKYYENVLLLSKEVNTMLAKQPKETVEEKK